jgi:hypothetical protein
MTPKSAILAELARSRAAIARDAALVREELDVTSHVKRSVRARPFVWLTCAAAVGYMLAGPKTRTRTVTKLIKGPKSAPVKAEKKRPLTFVGTLITLFKLAMPLVRPALSAYAARRVGDFAEKLGKR